ncbi:MAG: YaaA family protein [Prevotella sp.]
MQVLLADAKIMNNDTPICPETTPVFQEKANTMALEMASMDNVRLSQILHCSLSTANEAWKRYQNFFIAKKMPAIMAYNGQAYKHLKACDFDASGLDFAQRHLWITSFLYGLLRPMDAIAPYRIEHNVKLQSANGTPLSSYWRDTLTDLLIDSVKNDDGHIIHLSTAEYEQLFDWKRVNREVRIIHPMFYVRKNGYLKIQTVWAKTCRGAMTRFIMTNHIKTTDRLKEFSYEGFEYDPRLGEEAFPHFVKDI